MVQQMVTGDWLVLLHTLLWTKRWFVLALASENPLKKSSTSSGCSKRGWLCSALRHRCSEHPQHLVPVGKRGLSRKQELEQHCWVLFPRLFTDEGNAVH